MARTEGSDPGGWTSISPNGPVEGVGVDGYFASETLVVDNGKKKAVIKWLIGDKDNWPRPCPLNTKARCGRVSNIRPFAVPVENATVVQMLYIAMDVEYSENWLPFDDAFNVVTEFKEIPQKKLFWDVLAEKPLSPGTSPGVYTSLMEWTFTLRVFDKLHLDYLRLKTGGVNCADKLKPKRLDGVTVDIEDKDGTGFESQTLLYIGPQIQRVASNYGETIWDVRQTFVYNSHGWNMFVDPIEFNLIGGHPQAKYVNLYDEDGNVFYQYIPSSTPNGNDDVWKEELMFGELP